MSKLTIHIESPESEQIIRDLLKSLPDVTLEEDIVCYTTDGEAITRKEYTANIDAALDNLKVKIKDGNYTTLDDYKKKVEARSKIG